MKREEYWKILEIIDTLQNSENERSDRHCELNKDCPEEIRRRRDFQCTYNTALRDMRINLKQAFKAELEA